MRRIIFILAALLTLGTSDRASADDNCNLQNIEVELSAGLAWPMGSYDGGTGRTGSAFGVNLRYNLPKLPLDCGVFIQVLTAKRQYSSYFSDIYLGDYTLDNHTVGIGASCAYNLRKCAKVNPFAEIGIGVGLNFPPGDLGGNSCLTSPLFMPRIGVELWHIARVNCFMEVSRRGFNNVGVGIGIVLGGRPRR